MDSVACLNFIQWHYGPHYEKFLQTIPPSYDTTPSLCSNKQITHVFTLLTIVQPRNPERTQCFHTALLPVSSVIFQASSALAEGLLAQYNDYWFCSIGYCALWQVFEANNGSHYCPVNCVILPVPTTSSSTVLSDHKIPAASGHTLWEC